MQNNDDVAIIRRVLAGDEAAFAELVNKYQKPVHSLAWRKIGDFHIAEDITQDAFLKVYQRLSYPARSEPVFWVALCDYGKSMRYVAPQKTDTNATVGGHRDNDDTGRCLFPTRRGRAE